MGPSALCAFYVGYYSRYIRYTAQYPLRWIVFCVWAIYISGIIGHILLDCDANCLLAPILTATHTHGARAPHGLGPTAIGPVRSVHSLLRSLTTRY
eukprot:5476353-Pleurochrysis_carterae.AAC.2